MRKEIYDFDIEDLIDILDEVTVNDENDLLDYLQKSVDSGKTKICIHLNDSKRYFYVTTDHKKDMDIVTECRDSWLIADIIAYLKGKLKG